MAEHSKIEWTDHTFNPWTGCTKVSTANAGGGGCDLCYAEAWSKRAGPKVGKWGPGMPRVRTTPANWAKPLKWNAAHEAFFGQHGRRQRVFCASLADWLDNEVPIDWLIDLLDLIRHTPHLEWLLLSKRIGNFGKRLREAHCHLIERSNGNVPLSAFWVELWLDGEAPDNVWLGSTIVNQAEADRDITKLLAVPACVRFLSMEPLLGPVDLNYTRQCIQARRSQLARAINGEEWIDWVIVGGESGRGARPMHPDWARSLRDQCAAAGVPFMMKQMGGVRDKRGALKDLPEDLRVREFPNA